MPEERLRHGYSVLGDRVFALLLLAFAAAVFAYTFTFPQPAQPLDPGVTAFPRMVAVMIGVFALVILVRPEEGEALPRRSAAIRVVGTVLLLGVYAVIMDTVGFVVTTTLFLLAELLLIGVRRPTLLIFIPLGVSMGLFYLFRVFLEVPLPVSGLGWLPV
jgi:putative tricarboxylic transport membrane protein